MTPYTLGFTGRSGTDRQAYVADLAAALRTYRPLLDALGHGAGTAACELRFAPLVGIGPLTDTRIDGHHVLAVGPHLLISRQRSDGELPETVIECLDERTQPVYSRPGAPYLHITSQAAPPTAATVRAALAGTLTAPHRTRKVRLHRFTNADGPYYAADPDFHPDGTFTALHLYPATDVRPHSGYTDATRPLLNALLAHKRARGLARRDEFPHATSTDVAAVLHALTAQAHGLETADPAAAAHLREQIHPQAAAYAAALEQADYPPHLFFSRTFTIDTGQIVNQGRAEKLFRGLTATNGEPMTPREERGFGQASLSTVRGPDLADHPPAPRPRRPPAHRRHREEEPARQLPEPARGRTRPLPPVPGHAHHRLPPAPPRPGPARRLDRAHQHDAGPHRVRSARPAPDRHVEAVFTGARAEGERDAKPARPPGTAAILAAMTSAPSTPAAPFSRIKVRTGALVFCGDDIALIRRDRTGSTHYTPPGGNVEDGEDFRQALARELAEELDLDIDQADGGDLLWVVDQRVSRPGPTPPPRTLHLIYRLYITPEVRAALAEQGLDELPDGSHEVGVIEWVDYRKTADLPIFPPLGPALAALADPRATVGDAALDAVTDENYTWV
ncbi:NUDIX domain-containing protein [Streptomyces flaveolus]|uniref:NUDIX domain-containing protein n=1 Tax=Streptomyces flaveolus TaxID=67297 RepID=UPI00381ED2AE